MERIIEALKYGKSFVIVGHEKPDGDAIGSVCGLSCLLLDNEREVKTIFTDELPEKFKSIIPVKIDNQITIEELNRFDYLVVLDCARSSRINLPSNINLKDVAIPILNIDHHVDNDIDGTINYINNHAAATAEIISVMASHLEDKFNIAISHECAEMLYLGIVTDTGSFRFSNTTSTTFAMASFLLSKNANIEKIINAAYFSKKINQLKFEAEMINTCLKSACNNKYIYATIPQELFDKYQFDMRDGETVIEFLREIDTAIIVALIYPRDGNIKVSLRSKKICCPVGPIARKFNGGGHDMASGITFENSSWSEVEQLLLKEIGDCLKYEI